MKKIKLAVVINLFGTIGIICLLSHFFLKESLNHLQVISAVLILSATLINEFISIKK